MRVAFLSTISSYPWGGADTLWTRAAEAAVDRGDDVVIAIYPSTRRHARLDRLQERGATFALRQDACSSWSRRIWRRLHGAERDSVVKRLERFSPDLVVISCGGTYDLLAETPLRRWLENTGVRARMIANYQVEFPDLPEAQRETMRRCLPRLDRLFFVSERNLAATRRHLLVDLENARVVHNPLRASAPDELRPLSWADSQPLRLATISRLEHGKGIHAVLHAAARVLPPGGKWELDILGRGPDEALLRAIINRLGLAGRVHLRGYIPTLPEIWQSRHLLISASLEDGVPMTIPEALLCGRPVLATRVGAAEEWIRPGENGFLTVPTLEGLEAAIEQAWRERSEWATLGQAAAASARRFYRPQDFEQLIQGDAS